MLQVRYTLSFDLLRSVESACQNMFCCPGALTAYRASAVRRVLERWRPTPCISARPLSVRWPHDATYAFIALL